jgi:hypothetical protein
MKPLRSFPISPIFAFQPSAGPARGKGDRRAMAVIHTASRNGACLKLCSYFVLEPNASKNGKYAGASTARRPSPAEEKVLRCRFWATPFCR